MDEEAVGLLAPAQGLEMLGERVGGKLFDPPVQIVIEETAEAPDNKLKARHGELGALSQMIMIIILDNLINYCK